MPDSDSPADRSVRLTRSRAAAVWTAVLGVLVLLAVIDCATRGWFTIASAVFFGGAALCWLSLNLFVFPALIAHRDGLEVRNPLRTVFLPWNSIAQAGGRYFAELTDTAGEVTRVWAAPLSAVRTHKQKLRKKAADADLLASGIDPKAIPDHAQPGTVNLIRRTIAEHSGEKNKENSAPRQVRRTWNTTSWLVFTGLTAASIVFAVIA
ncbi:PH domain-containing protein [Brevibacterium ravenspurgense]|uniref:PH domain-containing protein n=1 Tax=Brevibacterium ravenspurgense TaxID=479117 RepID=UPI0007836DF7|nr:PH domain-containing protein [Brevibacterium ravenspurgense]